MKRKQIDKQIYISLIIFISIMLWVNLIDQGIMVQKDLYSAVFGAGLPMMVVMSV